MTSFLETNQVRSSLKMKFSNYCWYNSSIVMHDEFEGYYIAIYVTKFDDHVKKIIPPSFNNVTLKIFTK